MKKIYVCTISLTLLSCSLWAEETTELETLTITARPPGMGSLEHIAQPVDVLSNEKLEKSKSASIGETLSNQPGVMATAFGPYASRPIIRGLGGSRVLILQNGISSMDVSTVSTDHAVTIEPFQAQQIEIFRGPATLLYGSGASGGLINITNGRIPEYIPENLQASAETRFNTINQEKLFSFHLDGGGNNIALHADGTLRDADNYEAADKKIINSAYDNEDINLGASLVFDRGFAGLSIGRFDATHEIPLNPDSPEELPYIETEQDRVDFTVLLDDPLPGFYSLRLRGAYNDYQHIEFEGPGEMPGTTFFNDEWEARVELQHYVVANWNGSLGTQINLRSLEAVGDEAFIIPVKSSGFAIFALEETDVKNWHFEIGGRFEHKKYEPTATSEFTSVEHDVYSIAGGAHRHFSDDYSLGLSIARSQRIPSEEELFANGPHLATGSFEIGNPGLSEETSNNIDLSLNKEHGRLTWSVNLFVNYIEDYIFLNAVDMNRDGIADHVDVTGAPPGELLLTQITQDDAIFYGLEAESVYGLLEGNQGKLDLRLFGDYVRGKLSNENNLPRISPARIGVELDYIMSAWHANVDIINVFAQKDAAQLESKTGGYVQVNAGLDYSFTKPAWSMDNKLFIRASNLLDTDAERHTSFIKDRAPLPGRSLMFGIQVIY